MRPLLQILLVAACTPPETEVEPLDQRVDFVPTVESQEIFSTPDYVVPPHSDQTMCTFETYEGGDVAVWWAGFYQNLDWGHHVVLMASTASESAWPDGTVADCTTTNADIMTEARPFLFASDLTGGLQPEMNLPEGMGVKLKAGTRFVIQSHHINTTDMPILVNDRVFLATKPVEEIETFAAPYVNTQTDFVIPAGEAHSLDITCGFDEPVHLLSLLGHMHEWGTSYQVKHNDDEIYAVPDWNVQFRDAPPITLWQPGEKAIAAGDTFTTTCNWFNDTDEPLTFPHEMCATVGFAYPATVPIICEPDAAE